MQYAKLPALMRLSLPLCAMLALPACVGAPPIVATPGACSELLPPEWDKGVPGAPLPQGDQVAHWVAFGDAQTGQLDKSNDRYTAGVGIVRRCEARDAKAVQRARPKVLGIF